MKKVLALLLLAAMCLGLFAGCGKTESPAPETPSEPEVTDPAPEAPAEPEAPALTEPAWTEPVYSMENTVETRQQALTAPKSPCAIAQIAISEYASAVRCTRLARRKRRIAFPP